MFSRRSLIRAAAATGLALLLLAAQPLSAQTGSGARTPAHALELLKCLPSAPAEWKLTASTGRNSYSNNWARSEATREFTGPPTMVVTGGPELIPKVSVTLVDTGFYPGFLGLFEDFRPGPAEGGIEKLRVNDQPAVRSVLNDSTRQLQVLVARRFIVRVKATNLPPDGVMAWFRLTNTAPLAALAQQGATKLTEPMEMYVLDELNPKRNRTYQLQWMTEENIADPSTMPPPPKEVFE